MKKIFTLFSAIIFSVNVYSQAPMIQWQKCLGGTKEDFASCIQQTVDGGYIVVGTAVSNDSDVTGNHGGHDYWVVKLDSNASVQWQKCYGGSSFEEAHSVRQTSNGGYIIAGVTAFSNNGDVTGNHGYFDYWLVRLDDNGSIQWQKCYGGANYEEAFSVEEASDGGFILAGHSASTDGDVSGWHVGYNINGNRTSDYWIVKVDSNGSIEWQKCYGGSGEDLAYCIQQTSDGGYIVAGKSNSQNGDVIGIHSYYYDYWIIKLDTIGNIQWKKCYGGSYDDQANSVQQTSDGGYIVAGYAQGNDGDITGNHGWDYWVVKLDGSGNIQWQKCYGGGSTEKAYSVQQTMDGGYIVAGHSFSNDGNVTGNHGIWDYWVVKLDANGNILWNKSLGGTEADLAQHIQQTADGGYIIAGSTRSNDSDVLGWHVGPVTSGYLPLDYWIVKLTPDVVGVNEIISQEKNIFLSPNPATSEIRIESGEMKLAAVEVYDVVGSRVLKAEGGEQKGKITLNVSSLSPGIYFVTVRDEKGNRVTKKFVKM